MIICIKLDRPKVSRTSPFGGGGGEGSAYTPENQQHPLEDSQGGWVIVQGIV
jgi:hypothetical protein